MLRLRRLALLSLWAFAIPAWGLDPVYANTVVTHWVDGGGAYLKTWEEIQSEWDSDKPFSITQVRAGSGRGEDYYIVVNGTLYPSIQTKLVGSYIPKLESDGYSVNVYTTAGGTAADLRGFLIKHYVPGRPWNTLLVGSLPVAMFEIAGGFENGRAFPCDLFYMDLDGVWQDTDLDDAYDVHTGAVEADIRLGRLTAGPLVYGGQSEAELVEHYLDKALAYRNGQLHCQDRGLCYVDDDWSTWGLEWANYMRYAYPTTTAVYEKYETWDTDYETRLREDYEFIQVCVHSNPVLHQFVRPGPLYGYTYMSELYALKPKALFYNLFACSNARFTESNYMAGWYTFMDNEYGVAAVGSAKTGSMLHFEDFYGPLRDGDTLGESFRSWMAKWADSDGDTSRDWHYGMTIIGDPTFYIHGHSIPVTVREFTARPAGPAVALRWDVNAIPAYAGFNLYRSPQDGGCRERVNADIITGRNPFSYLDTAVAAGHGYDYDLEGIDVAGKGVVLATATADLRARPASLTLAAPFPNPARTEVTLAYASPTGKAELSAYDAAGRKIRSWRLDSAGSGETVWHLDAGGGGRIPPGVYWIALTAEGTSIRRPMIVLNP